jgi:hypothetical protein
MDSPPLRGACLAFSETPVEATAFRPWDSRPPYRSGFSPGAFGSYPRPFLLALQNELTVNQTNTTASPAYTCPCRSCQPAALTVCHAWLRKKTANIAKKTPVICSARMLPARANGPTIAAPNRPAPRASLRPPSAAAAAAWLAAAPASRDAARTCAAAGVAGAFTGDAALAACACAARSRIVFAATRALIPSTCPSFFGCMSRVYRFPRSGFPHPLLLHMCAPPIHIARGEHQKLR